MKTSRYLFGLFAALFIGSAVADEEIIIELGECFFDASGGDTPSFVNNGLAKIKWWVTEPTDKELGGVAGGQLPGAAPTTAFLSIGKVLVTTITSDAQRKQFKQYNNAYLPESFSGEYSDGGLKEVTYKVSINRTTKLAQFTYNGNSYTNPRCAVKYGRAHTWYSVDKTDWELLRARYCTDKTDTSCSVS